MSEKGRLASPPNPMRRRSEFPRGMLHTTFVVHARIVRAAGMGSWSRSNCFSARIRANARGYWARKQDLVHAPNDGIKLRVAQYDGLISFFRVRNRAACP